MAVIAAVAAIGATALFTLPVNAAVVTAETAQEEIRPGDVLEASFSMDTEGEDVNAIEGIVTIPSALQVQDVNDGNSDVTFWIEQPARTDDGNIRFAGIIPGGRTDSSLRLFSLFLQAGSEGGSGTVDIQNLQVFLNDGEGTETASAFYPLSMTVREDADLVPAPPPEPKDIEAPETFEPLIMQDPYIADGKNVIVFVTQDKASGVDHYEVFETRRRITRKSDVEWEEAESPYVLKDQELKSYIYVKAEDREGNKRIVRVSPTNELTWYERNKVFVIIAVAICVILVLVFANRNNYGGVWRRK